MYDQPPRGPGGAGDAGGQAGDGGTVQRAGQPRREPPQGPREVTGLVSSSPAAYDKGQKVSVLYDRSSGEARINAGLERWFFVALLGGLGGVFVIVSRVVGFFTKLAKR